MARGKESFRNNAYELVGAVVSSSAFEGFAARLLRNRYNIVYYHGVWPRDDFRLRLYGDLDLAMFENHLHKFAQRFQFQSIGDCLKNKSTKPVLSVTFDDGFDLIESGVADVLEKFGVSATLFVCSDAYKYTRILWQHSFRLIREMRCEQLFLKSFNKVQAENSIGYSIAKYDDWVPATRCWPQSRVLELADSVWAISGMPEMSVLLSDHRPYMDEKKLIEWLRRGHTLGFHSRSHLWAGRLNITQIEDEYITPAVQLRQELALEDLPFSYPFGNRPSRECESEIIRSGVASCLLGTDRISLRRSSPFTVDRCEPHEFLDYRHFGRVLLRGTLMKRH